MFPTVDNRSIIINPLVPTQPSVKQKYEKNLKGMKYRSGRKDLKKKDAIVVRT